MLEVERKVYDDHVTEWSKSHLGQFVLIKGTEVVGFFPTPDEALTVAASKYGLDSYLIRPVNPEPSEVAIPALTLGLLSAHR